MNASDEDFDTSAEFASDEDFRTGEGSKTSEIASDEGFKTEAEVVLVEDFNAAARAAALPHAADVDTVLAMSSLAARAAVAFFGGAAARFEVNFCIVDSETVVRASDEGLADSAMERNLAELDVFASDEGFKSAPATGWASKEDLKVSAAGSKVF